MVGGGAGSIHAAQAGHLALFTWSVTVGRQYVVSVQTNDAILNNIPWEKSCVSGTKSQILSENYLNHLLSFRLCTRNIYDPTELWSKYM